MNGEGGITEGKEYYSTGREPFGIGRIDVLTVTRRAGFLARRSSGREKASFLFTAAGRMRYRFSGTGEELSAPAGTLVYIPRGAVHTSVYETDACVRIVQFVIPEGETPAYLTRPMIAALPDAQELMDSFFPPAADEGDRGLYCRYRLYGLLFRLSCGAQASPDGRQCLLPALTAMQTRWAEKRTVGEYARMCGMSETSFRRKFREAMGCSPVEYRNAIRLSEARARLMSGEYTVTEAAEAAGIENLSYFGRIYRARYGHMPSGSAERSSASDV